MIRAKASGGHETKKFQFGMFLVFPAIESELILPNPGIGKEGREVSLQTPAIIHFCFSWLLINLF